MNKTQICQYLLLGMWGLTSPKAAGQHLHLWSSNTEHCVHTKIEDDHGRTALLSSSDDLMAVTKAVSSYFLVYLTASRYARRSSSIVQGLVLRYDNKYCLPQSSLHVQGEMSCQEGCKGTVNWLRLAERAAAMEHQLSVLGIERREQGLSFKEIHKERHGMLFTPYDQELFPYIEGRIKKLEGWTWRKSNRQVRKSRTRYLLWNL